MATYIPPDMQIGDNLYAKTNGDHYYLTNGNKNYIKSPFDSTADRLNMMYNAQKKSQLDSLTQQRTKAVSGFNQQKKDLKPQFQAQRNQADVVNSQNVSKLRELMAANGINASGENITASADLASARQTSLNDITNNEQTAYRDIDRQIAQVNDPAQEQAILNAIEAERTRGLSGAWSQAQQFSYQQNQDYLAKQWQNYIFNNLSADQRASLGMNKYGIDTNNAASGAASQAELDFYQNQGFLIP